MRRQIVDLVGQKFGRLTVEAFDGYKPLTNGHRVCLWRCRCECGAIVAGQTGALRFGSIRSCGCLRKTSAFKRQQNRRDNAIPVKDFTGRVFGRLRVVSFAGYRPGIGQHVGHWSCDCSCGAKVTVSGKALVDGNTRSCGCYHRDRAREARTGTVPASRLDAGESEFRRLYRHYASRAARRGMAFTLTTDRFRSLTRAPCHYCGGEPCCVSKCGRSYGAYVYNGIDRMDNNLGYVPENCVACCEVCNKAKRHMDADTFVAWVFRAAKHLSPAT